MPRACSFYKSSITMTMIITTITIPAITVATIRDSCSSFSTTFIVTAILASLSYNQTTIFQKNLFPQVFYSNYPHFIRSLQQLFSHNHHFLKGFYRIFTKSKKLRNHKALRGYLQQLHLRDLLPRSFLEITNRRKNPQGCNP